MIRLVILFFLVTNIAQAQIGKFLKGAKNTQVGQMLKKKGTSLLSQKLDNTRAKFDTASFSYSISLSDKAASFDNKENYKDVVTVGSMVVDSDEPRTPMDEAREYLDVGEMALASNGYRLAEISLITSAIILEADGQQEHPIYSRNLADLGMLYNSMGRYGLSEEFTKRALDLRKRLRGEESVDYAASLNNLGVLNKNRGNYNEAEKELTEAIELNKRVEGAESLPYAIALNNRGVLYQILGRYELAEGDMLSALEVAALNMKPNSGQYTRLQTNLALLYQQQGDYAEAETIFKSAIGAISRNPLKSKKTNPDYAHMAENLASLYVLMGEYDDAEVLYKEAITVYARKFGTSYSGYGLAMARLASMYRQTNRLNEADDMLNQAYGIIVNAYGPNHPVTVDTQTELALLSWEQLDLVKSADYFTQALDKSLEFVGSYFAPMSESEKAAYWKTLQPRFEKYYAFIAINDTDPEVLAKALDYRLATKAMLLTSSTKIKNHILTSGDTLLVNDYKKWLDQKEQLAMYYNMSAEDIKEQKVNVDSLTLVANALEKTLSERSGLFDEAYHTVNPTTQDISHKISDGAAAIEIIRTGFDLHGDKVQYLALILTNAGIKKVTISGGADLENKHYKLYRNMIRLKKPDQYSYSKFWEPLASALSSEQIVYLSIDGVYNQVNLNTMQDNTGNYVIDKWQIHNLTSLRDLTHDPHRSLNKSATLMGNPDYGSSSISPLPGTAVEIQNVDRILKTGQYKTKVYSAKEASEAELKKSTNPNILHIATHGYFVKDPDETNTSVYSVPLYNVNENVLLRSGLLLEGVGNESDDMSLQDANNGILTAYEVLGLTLDETDLVVLSACETGLGDVLAGEGVYGLQRAFQVAGTNAVIMSLWKVDDAATQELMSIFYRELIKSSNKQTAFRFAQQKIKEKYPEPYYWGGFLLIGS